VTFWYRIYSKPFIRTEEVIYHDKDSINRDSPGVPSYLEYHGMLTGDVTIQSGSLTAISVTPSVTAYDASGNESGYSNEMSKIIQ
jgi:hypothetical protein